ncbi:MAG: L,D-transpeptidase family protein, partial [Akkermansiaceae bacterium]|nr:L,D-transpeptidase family protein [Akkermansiaceae bacterium]
DGWNASAASLVLFEKQGGVWRQFGKPWQARLGKSGLAWGLGLQPVPAGAATKREGDLRTPAGVFYIGGVWGYARTIRKHPGLFYHRVNSRDLWIEDPESESYNRHVMLDHEPATAWEKKQQMKQHDPAHSLKLFIAHNAPPKVKPGAGSSIFFHIWRDGGGRATAGCTAMAETRLKSLIAWLDPGRKPIYVLLPKAEYERYKKVWKLP